MESEKWVKIRSQGERQHLWVIYSGSEHVQLLFKCMLLVLYPSEYFLTGGLDQFLLHSASHTLQMQAGQ